MKLLKRAAAALLSLCTLFTCASCGENTANAAKVDGTDVRAGVYLYYAVNAYNDAISELTKKGEKFDEAKETKDVKKIVKDINLDNVTVEEWIQNKATEYCQTFVAVQREFDKLGLKLNGEELARIDATTNSNMQTFGDFFKASGIGEQSVREIVTVSYKQNALWKAYYGDDGSKNISEDTLKQHYLDNHFRFKYIQMPLKDGEGNLLKADGKEEIEKMAQDYLARLAKKAGNEADLMTEFDYLIDEHNNYVTSLSEAAVTTTDDQGNTITTPTTTKATTTEATTTAETTSAGGEQGEQTTTTAAASSEGDQTTTTAETAASSGDVTTASTETTETTTTVSSTTGETNHLGYSTDKEKVYAVSTTAKQEEGKEDTTTAEPSYTPCEKVYKFASDPATPLLKPELIKDEETYYIVIKMDLKDRMTTDDRWTDSQKESVREELYFKEFSDMLDDMGKALPVERNEAAYKRYHVLDLDVIGYQAALYSSYYSSYYGS